MPTKHTVQYQKDHARFLQQMKGMDTDEIERSVLALLDKHNMKVEDVGIKYLKTPNGPEMLFSQSFFAGTDIETVLFKTVDENNLIYLTDGDLV